MWRIFFFCFCFLSTLALAEEELPTALSPEGHKSHRFTGEFGVQEYLGTFFAAQFRLALHDFTDPLTGYSPDTRLDLALVKARVHTRNPKFWLDEAVLVRFERLPPLSDISNELSWTVEVLAETIRDRNCDHCIAGVTRGFLGVSGEVFKDPILEYFLLVGGEVSSTTKYSRAGTKLGAGPRAGFRANFSDGFRMSGFADYRYLLWSTFPHRWSVGFEGRVSLLEQLALYFRSTGFPDGWEAATGLSVYF